jgi:hypothetical protein
MSSAVLLKRENKNGTAVYVAKEITLKEMAAKIE